MLAVPALTVLAAGHPAHWSTDLSHNSIAVAAAVVLLVVGMVVLARRSRSGPVQRDPQRSFTAAQRAVIFARAGNRCEYVTLFRRCSAAPTHADHIYPWSAGGATTLANAAATCQRHNLTKGAHLPPRRYLRRLERRRRRYFLAGTPVEVSWRVGTRS